MADVITERALKIALEKFGWKQAAFARALGVDKANITNWLSRGMPPSRYAQVAKKLQITVDELLGESPEDRKAANRVSEPTVLAYGVHLTEDAVLFAAEWAKLRSPLKAQLQALVQTLVGEQVREDRGKPRPPAAPGRPNA